MRSLTLREKVAQLVIAPYYSDVVSTTSQQYQAYLRLVRDTKVGGLVLINRSEPYRLAAFLNRMQRASKVPLIVAGDFERSVSMRVASETQLPHAMAFTATRDPELSRFAGDVTARQGRALGVPWILAPVADVNNNPDNPIINIRSYGENPEDVSAHVAAFIDGARNATREPVLVTVKHFPGHGDTGTDSHLALPVITADRERIERVELAPFRTAIQHGADAVMSAHIAVPALGEPERPATLSAAVLTKLLREDMGFKGLIATDAMDMRGLTRQWPGGEAAVQSLEAGADVLLMPPDPNLAIDAVVAAIRSGRLKQARVDASVRRLLDAKARLGLHRRRVVDIEQVMEELDAAKDIERTQEVADRSVTLVKNEGAIVPLRDPAQACFVVLTESRGSQAGRVFVSEVRKREAKASVTVLDPQMTAADSADTVERLSQCGIAVVAAFVSVAAYRGSVALAGEFPALVNAILATGKPVALIALGNPYLIRSFAAAGAYLTTYSTVPPSEAAVVKALFGEIPVRGRLPVTIPAIATYGDGIQLPGPVR